jgi:murein DD-endopeptidase MepM/ murein hydrolase activator NlpD
MLSTNTTSAARRRMLFTLIVLLAVNAGVINLLVNQIAITADAQANNVVKDEEVTAGDVDKITANGTIDPIEEDKAAPEISTYVVVEGDTLSSIAEKFDISTNTIRWANDLGIKAVIHVGQKLVILPVTGIQYTVKKGDTISGITKKFDADQAEILDYNDLEDPSEVKEGMKLIIPNADPLPTPVKAPTKSKTANTSNQSTAPTPSKVSSGRFIHPIPGSIMTQGLHAVGGIDFGAPIGTTVRAAAAGTVILAKGGGYNGGFGTYIVIDHGDGTQTLYAHLSQLNTSVGEKVNQGEKIAESGNTGHSTGPHLHFEVHGATNPYTRSKVGTHF